VDDRKTDRIPPAGDPREERKGRPCLTVYEGPDLGRDFPLEEGRTLAGRDLETGIPIRDSAVSRNHLALVVDGSGDCVLEDLGSTNGTFVNGERIERRRLRPGDRIQVGSTLLKFDYKRPGSSRYTRKLYQMATRDPRTGLLNVKSFEDQLEQFWALSHRTGQPLGLLMIDIDRFKQVNDRHGHETGNEVLRQLAECLRAGVRKPDLVARYGGEEFAVILPGQGPEGAMKMAQRLREQVEDLRLEDLGPDGITVSIGVASVVPMGDAPAKTLVDSADKALYEAKEAGRNRCCSSSG